MDAVPGALRRRAQRAQRLGERVSFLVEDLIQAKSATTVTG
jgi:hypothetical protein